MSKRICSVFVLAAALMWHCGGDRVMQSKTDEERPRPLSKLAVAQHATQAMVAVTLHSNGMPISGATVAFSRSIAGHAPDYQWSGTTDEKGQVGVEIASGTGYYQARASQNGSEIGSWSSIPINAGYKVVIDLPIGEQARVTGSYALEPQEITARDVVDPKTLQAFVEAAKEYAQDILLSDEMRQAFNTEGGRWKHEDIYLAILNSDGAIVFHGGNPALEGQNLINLEDINGVRYIQELLDAAAVGGGFVGYYFDNPAIDENGDGELLGDPIGSPKVSYALPITDPQTGMVFTLVAGVYPQVPAKEITARDVVDPTTLKAFVEAAKEYAQDILLSDEMRQAFNTEGGRWKHEDIYLSIGNDDGVILFHGGNPALEGQNLIDLEDINGVRYIQELIAAAAMGGGFVGYYFDNPAIDENGDGELLGDPIGSPKISYALPITDPQTGMVLILVAGVYPKG